MHGFNWIMEVFMYLVIYGFALPVLISWICMLTLFHYAPKVWLVFGTVSHAVGLIWIMMIRLDILLALLCTAGYLAFYLTWKKQYRMYNAQGDLYAKDIKVVQPNELKR